MMFKKAIDDNHDNLFFFLLFLRISPLLPNWLINLASPVVGVPFKYFLLATILGITQNNLGLIPANIMHCYMGTTLASIEKIGFDIKVCWIYIKKDTPVSTNFRLIRINSGLDQKEVCQEI